MGHIFSMRLASMYRHALCIDFRHTRALRRAAGTRRRSPVNDARGMAAAPSGTRERGVPSQIAADMCHEARPARAIVRRPGSWPPRRSWRRVGEDNYIRFAATPSQR